MLYNIRFEKEARQKLNFRRKRINITTIKRIISSFCTPDIMHFSDFKDFLPSLFLLIYFLNSIKLYFSLLTVT